MNAKSITRGRRGVFEPFSALRPPPFEKIPPSVKGYGPATSNLYSSAGATGMVIVGATAVMLTGFFGAISSWPTGENPLEDELKMAIGVTLGGLALGTVGLGVGHVGNARMVRDLGRRGIDVNHKPLRWAQAAAGLTGICIIAPTVGLQVGDVTILRPVESELATLLFGIGIPFFYYNSVISLEAQRITSLRALEDSEQAGPFIEPESDFSIQLAASPSGLGLTGTF